MGKNKNVGNWSESKFIEIDLEFNKENLVELLNSVVNKSNNFSHQQVCNWCDKYYMKYINESNFYNIELYKVLEDISAQWELFLTNTYSIEELQQLDFSKVELPVEWFYRWLKDYLKNISI